MKYLLEYLNFILESVEENKARVYYSNEFRDILDRIQHTSPVSQALMHAENNSQALDSYTLIDITDKNDTISFVQVSRIKRKYPEDSIERQSYVFSKDSTNPGGEFWREGRSEMKVGRWSKRFLEATKVSVTDKQIEDFVNSYKAAYDGRNNPKFEILTGEDIRNAYLVDNYETKKGQLGASCMRYQSCQEYLDIYVKNPDVCKLLVLRGTDPSKIIGRSLIWKFKDVIGGPDTSKYYMDRIYTSCDSDKKLFEEWALINTLEKNMSHYGEIGISVISVQLGDYLYEKYPYMDTFLCYNQ
jgi:hypothetical protein